MMNHTDECLLHTKDGKPAPRPVYGFDGLRLRRSTASTVYGFDGGAGSCGVEKVSMITIALLGREPRCSQRGELQSDAGNKARLRAYGAKTKTAAVEVGRKGRDYGRCGD